MSGSRRNGTVQIGRQRERSCDSRSWAVKPMAKRNHKQHHGCSDAVHTLLASLATKLAQLECTSDGVRARSGLGQLV
jgi:hypothetical protein